MAVHFDFMMDDIDAQRLMTFLNTAKCSFLKKATKLAKAGDTENIHLMEELADGVDELTERMTNTHVSHPTERDIVSIDRNLLKALCNAAQAIARRPTEPNRKKLLMELIDRTHKEVKSVTLQDVHLHKESQDHEKKTI